MLSDRELGNDWAYRARRSITFSFWRTATVGTFLKKRTRKGLSEKGLQHKRYKRWYGEGGEDRRDIPGRGKAGRRDPQPSGGEDLTLPALHLADYVIKPFVPRWAVKVSLYEEPLAVAFKLWRLDTGTIHKLRILELHVFLGYYCGPSTSLCLLSHCFISHITLEQIKDR